jgi:DNA helicase HerA-like ATPase
MRPVPRGVAVSHGSTPGNTIPRLPQRVRGRGWRSLGPLPTFAPAERPHAETRSNRIIMQAWEKLGSFYLGRRYDAAASRVTDEPVFYDAKDLTTHAVCVGMTGSGKTGLCLGLLEEAAIDGVPAIAIDPKGDLGNLLLTFPALQPSDFEPWISADEAGRKGRTVTEHARDVAETWRKGLADWAQDGERIRRMRETTEFVIYTPGSTAGRPLSLLRSLDAPPPALLADADALRERVLGAASGLLTLVGIEPDPIRSREHILLSTLLDQAWREGRNLEIAELVRRIQKPGFDRIGVIDLETFYPANDRFALAMTLNNLLASPGFAAWMEGESLDINRLFWTESGRPRIAILSIAHLSDAERMFFVTLLLNEVVAWMRTQPGSASLRALLYMDEVFGFFPPVANPPSKVPMLTLLKQARAFGLGVVLATQNPVDLDYKGLSNAGTWFLGRLQTERDKQRVLDGLESAAAGTSGFNREAADAVLSNLPGRVFLLHNVHEDGPVLMHTRWALSYLRGPMTREEIRRLTPARAEAPQAAAVPPGAAPRAPHVATTGASAASGTAASASAGLSPNRPVVAADVAEQFVFPTRTLGGTRVYRPALAARVHCHFVDAKLRIDEWRDVGYVAPLDAATVSSPWAHASRAPAHASPSNEPAPGFVFAELPALAQRAATWKSWQKGAADHALRTESLTRFRSTELGETSLPDEGEAQFRVRLSLTAREQRDAAVEKMRSRYAARLRQLEQRLRTAEERVAREQAQYQQQKMQTAISVGATVLGAVFGRKMSRAGTVGRATSAARGAGRIGQQREDVGRAQDNVETVLAEQQELARQIEAESAELQTKFDPAALTFETVEIKPRKSDLATLALLLLWIPFEVMTDGTVQSVG